MPIDRPAPLRYLSAADVAAALPPVEERLALARRTLLALVADAELPPKIAVHPRPDASFGHAMPALLRGGAPDGSEDLMVGVYKTARFHPVMANRPFIYGWDGKTMYPKWLGSRLSRPFTDFVLADFGSGVRIVAVEQTREGANELAVYRWEGFGVTRVWNGAGSKKLTDLVAIGDLGKQSIRVTSGSSTRSYIWKNNSLQPKEARN